MKRLLILAIWQHQILVCWINYMYMYVTTLSMGLLNRQSIHDNIQWFHSHRSSLLTRIMIPITPPLYTPTVHSHQSQITLTVLLQSRTMTLVRNHNSWILTLLVSSRSSSRFLSIITFWRITACCKKTKTTSTDSIEIKIICCCSHCTCTSICVDSLYPKTYCKTILLNNPRILKSVNLILNWFLS